MGEIEVMKILVTGANGFVGKNLIAELKNKGYQEIYEYDIDTPATSLPLFCEDCDFIFNLAGINRTADECEFITGNFDFISRILGLLKHYENKCPIMNSSSIQALQDTPYGRSKKAGEDLILTYAKQNGVKVYNYRLPNVFGKWCRPNYNSVVATFCHNIANGLPIQVNDRNTELQLAYIDDVVDELLRALENQAHLDEKGHGYIPVLHNVKLGEIADMIKMFAESRESLMIPCMESNSLSKKLYSTYLSYLPPEKFIYPLKMNIDGRGSFTEILKTPERGQVSVNISKPGIVKGNHWHHSKNEKFIVVSGKGIIRFRKVGAEEIIEVKVSGEKIEVVDIPTGYTHEIINIGESDLITLMWANECFDFDKPDTYYEKIKGEN